MNSNSLSKPQSGFTLIEVLIAMVLLVMISLAIFQATTGTYRLRDTLMNEGDFYNSVRLTMTIMERDIGQMYSPTIMLPNPNPSSSPTPLTANANSTPDIATQYWDLSIASNGVRPMRFQGDDQKISFVSISHLRVHQDAPESEFEKITYELKDAKALADTSEGKVLVKQFSTNAFDDDDVEKDKFQREYALLPGVLKLKYRYYRKDTDKWQPKWDSDETETKNIYPDIVELTIEVRGTERQHFDGLYSFRPEIPLRALDPNF